MESTGIRNRTGVTGAKVVPLLAPAVNGEDERQQRLEYWSELLVQGCAATEQMVYGRILEVLGPATDAGARAVVEAVRVCMGPSLAGQRVA